ncbi:MAG: hypothetical protein IPJ85_01370 [Flavobacteriales bacterium]|nr:hypothetical protein [Flavobacteriales bacterium]
MQANGDPSPNDDWEATFLTDSIAQLYQAEDKLFRVFTAFAVLTILLTIMGLYGLAYFTAKQRSARSAFAASWALHYSIS